MPGLQFSRQLQDFRLLELDLLLRLGFYSFILKKKWLFKATKSGLSGMEKLDQYDDWNALYVPERWVRQGPSKQSRSGTPFSNYQDTSTGSKDSNEDVKKPQLQNVA